MKMNSPASEPVGRGGVPSVCVGVCAAAGLFRRGGLLYGAPVKLPISCVIRQIGPVDV